MAPVRVPPKQRPAILQLSMFSDEQFEFLLTAVSPHEETLSRSRVALATAESLGIKPEESSLLIRALLGAHVVYRRESKSTYDVAGEIASDPSLKLDETQQVRVRQRLAILLGVGQLATLSAASQLFNEDQQTFCTARTLSDIRPVFDIDTDELQSSSVVIKHSLKIWFHRNGPERETFYVTLDERDLQHLTAVLSRAMDKAQVLRSMARAAGLQVVEVEESH